MIPGRIVAFLDCCCGRVGCLSSDSNGISRFFLENKALDVAFLNWEYSG